MNARREFMEIVCFLVCLYSGTFLLEFILEVFFL